MDKINQHCKRLHFNVTEDQDAKLKKYTKDNKIKVSVLLRNLLDKELRKLK